MPLPVCRRAGKQAERERVPEAFVVAGVQVDGEEHDAEAGEAGVVQAGAGDDLSDAGGGEHQHPIQRSARQGEEPQGQVQIQEPEDQIQSAEADTAPQGTEFQPPFVPEAQQDRDQGGDRHQAFVLDVGEISAMPAIGVPGTQSVEEQQQAQQ